MYNLFLISYNYIGTVDFVAMVIKNLFFGKIVFDEAFPVWNRTTLSIFFQVHTSGCNTHRYKLSIVSHLKFVRIIFNRILTL